MDSNTTGDGFDEFNGVTVDDFDFSHLPTLTTQDTGWGHIPIQGHIIEWLSIINMFVRPKVIFDIGFLAGHSATMLLYAFPQATVVSCGPDPKRNMPKVMKEKFGDRFHFFRAMSDNPRMHDVIQTKFTRCDLGFIDGMHDTKSVVEDIEICRKLGCKWLIFDNMERKTVEKGANRHGSLRLGGAIDYESHWKGKTTLCKLAVYKDESKRHFIQKPVRSQPAAVRV